MRALVLALALLTLAGSAFGLPRQHGRYGPPPAPPTLRGLQTPAETPTPTPALTLPAGPGPAGLVSLPPAEPAECRRACARSYYFCLAEDSPDACGPTWGQCRSACEAPSYGGPSAR